MKISVVVPVYNSEKYIAICVKSVLNQTYNNWELILVDDGSIDSSSQIIDDMAEKDTRIIVIHQENAGPGEARNRGIREATGDYVVFLDSDDYIDKDYFKLLVTKAEHSDVVFIDVCQVDSNGKKLKDESMSKYKSWSKDKILRSQMTGNIPWGGVRKAVRLNLLRENGIYYTKHSVGEEALYSFKILYLAEKVDFIDGKMLYFYVNHENSQSKLNLIDPWGGVVRIIGEYLKEQELLDAYGDTLNAFNATSTVVSLDKIAQNFRGKEMTYKAKERLEEFKKSYLDSSKIDIKNMSLKAKIFVPFLQCNIYSPIIFVSRFRRFINSIF